MQLPRRQGGGSCPGCLVEAGDQHALQPRRARILHKEGPPRCHAGRGGDGLGRAATTQLRRLVPAGMWAELPTSLETPEPEIYYETSARQNIYKEFLRFLSQASEGPRLRGRAGLRASPSPPQAPVRRLPLLIHADQRPLLRRLRRQPHPLQPGVRQLPPGLSGHTGRPLPAVGTQEEEAGLLEEDQQRVQQPHLLQQRHSGDALLEPGWGPRRGPGEPGRGGHWASMPPTPGAGMGLSGGLGPGAHPQGPHLFQRPRQHPAPSLHTSLKTRRDRPSPRSRKGLSSEEISGA